MCTKDLRLYDIITFPVSRAIYEIMWKITIHPGRPQITLWRMLLACWITNATDTNSERVNLLLFHRGKDYVNAPHIPFIRTRVGTLIVATIYLQLIQNRYTFRSFTVLQCSHQHCVQPLASDVEVVGYL